MLGELLPERTAESREELLLKRMIIEIPVRSSRSGSKMQMQMLLLIVALFLPLPAEAAACNTQCGGLKVAYPFGIDRDGCGNALYRLNSCNSNSPSVQLNGTAVAASSIDYDGRTIFLRNPEACPFPALPAGISILYCGVTDGTSTLCLNSTGSNSCCISKSGSGNVSGCSNYSANTTATGGAPIEPSNVRLVWDGNAVFESNCTECRKTNGHCGYNTTTGGGFVCLCGGFNRTGNCDCESNNSCRQNKKPIILSGTLAVVIIVVVLVFGVSLSIYWKWKKNGREDEVGQEPVFPMESETRDNIRDLLSARRGADAAKVFTLAEVEKATNGFSKDNKIGSGGFGTVYKAVFGGTVLAVKRANQASKHSSQHFLNEVTVLSQVNHRNLVRLIGCCIDTDVPMLVYEYVPNGTLFDHLHKRPTSGQVLDWSSRLRIAIETAEALAYLHSAAMPPIYHRDVKSSNILLEYNFTAKVADFGLSRLVPVDATHVSTMVQGTPGYLDPEYHQTYQLTDKSDVYSFGVVLLEIVTGRKPVDFSRASRDVNLSAYSVPLIRKGMVAELLDPRLDASVLDPVRRVANLAVACLAFFREDRPTHAHITSNGHDADTFIGNLLVEMYGKCGRIEEAKKAFDSIAVPNAYSWTSMVAAFAQNGQSAEALDYFTRMWQMGLRPATSILYIHLLRCCKSVDDGRLLHGRISGQGGLDQKDVFVGTALMNMYASFACIGDARRVFDNLNFKDQVAWTSMISAYAHMKGSEKLAVELYHQIDVPADAIALAAVVDACIALVDIETGLLVHRRSQLEGFKSMVLATSLIRLFGRCNHYLWLARGIFDDWRRWRGSVVDVVAWNAMVAALTMNGHFVEAIRLFEEMEVEPSRVTYALLFDACGCAGELDKGKLLHGQLGAVNNDSVLCTALVNMYGRCGAVQEAGLVFDTMVETSRDVIAWSSMVSAYARNGCSIAALELFERMRTECKQPPDALTYVAVLHACSHAGLVNEARSHFDEMKNVYHIRPAEEHYGCMVDLLGRVGELQEAEQVLTAVNEMQANQVAWTSLLKACVLHLDADRGARAARAILKINPSTSEPLVALAGLYASCGRAQDAAAIEAELVTMTNVL